MSEIGFFLGVIIIAAALAAEHWRWARSVRQQAMERP